MPNNSVTPGLFHRLTKEQGLAKFTQRIDEAEAYARTLRWYGRPSWVYFMESNPGGFIKIGWSIKPVWRLTDILSILPPNVQIRLVAIVRGGYDDERTLHQRFAHLRVRNEWFEPSPEIHGYIRDRAEVIADDFLAGLAQGDAVPSQDNKKARSVGG